MEVYEYGNSSASTIWIQPVDARDLAEIEQEILEIQKRTEKEFRLIAVKVDSWNDDLSPWSAPAVFGTAEFGGKAPAMLEKILTLCNDKSKTYYICGYSLAGLFALWTACQTNVFAGVAAASTSVWFPGFLDCMKEDGVKSQTVYLSLGDREEKTKNPVMAAVGDCIRESYDWLQKQGISSTLEWNPGNHFREPEVRVAKGVAWVINQTSHSSVYPKQ